MQFLCGFAIRLMGFFFGVKTPNIENFFLMRNLSLPTSVPIFHPRQSSYPFQPVHVICFAICPILPTRCFPKILESIVRLVSVDVVNLVFGHFSSYIKPRKPMSRIGFPIYFNVNISLVLFEVARSVPNLYLRARQRPFENPCLGVIGKYGKKVRMFHAANLPERRWDCNLGGLHYV